MRRRKKRSIGVSLLLIGLGVVIGSSLTLFIIGLTSQSEVATPYPLAISDTGSRNDCEPWRTESLKNPPYATEFGIGWYVSTCRLLLSERLAYDDIMLDAWMQRLMLEVYRARQINMIHYVSEAGEAAVDIENNDTIEEIEAPLYEGQVYLTFDDGPSKLTSEVLAILAAREIPATFFVLGEKLERYPEIAEQIVAEGHSIGNHSYNHEYKELYRSPQNFVDQVLQTTRLIHEITGVATRLFRAPGGSVGNLDDSYMNALHEAGYRVFDWNVDSRDSSSNKMEAKEILSHITESTLTKRMIVLLHDSATHAETVKALPLIIEYFQEQNYQFEKITEETEPLTFKVAKSIRWERGQMSDKHVDKLKKESMKLFSQ